MFFLNLHRNTVAMIIVGQKNAKGSGFLILNEMVSFLLLVRRER